MIILIVLLLLIKYWEKLLPDSIIPYSVNPYRMEISNEREYSFLEEELLDELDEITLFDNEYPFLIRNYNCRVVVLKDQDTISEDLVLFGNNSFTWKDSSYLKTNERIIFPESGSYINNPHPKQYYGKPLRVIIGKKLY